MLIIKGFSHINSALPAPADHDLVAVGSNFMLWREGSGYTAQLSLDSGKTLLIGVYWLLVQLEFVGVDGAESARRVAG